MFESGLPWVLFDEQLKYVAGLRYEKEVEAQLISQAIKRPRLDSSNPQDQLIDNACQNCVAKSE